jgi:hypothetical protein
MTNDGCKALKKYAFGTRKYDQILTIQKSLIIKWL